MKCYVHQNVDAVGVCSSCGRGVCRQCAVRLGGKIYCKEDADRVFASARVTVARREDPDRGFGVILGSIFAYVLGGVSGLVACLIIFDAIVAGSTSSGGGLFVSLFSNDLSFLGPIQQYPSGTITSIGIAVLIFASFGIAAGFYMWRPTRAGAVMSIAFGVLGLVGAFELSSISVTPWLVDSWFALSGLTIAMSFIGLVQLTRAPPKPVGPLGAPSAYARPKNK